MIELVIIAWLIWAGAMTWLWRRLARRMRDVEFKTGIRK